MRRAAHPAMRVVCPPASAGQSRRLSSSPRMTSVDDMDDNVDDVDDGGSGLWQREQRDLIVIVLVFDEDNDKDNDCIV